MKTVKTLSSVAVLMAVSTSSFAQAALPALEEGLTALQVGLLALGVVLLTIVLMYAALMWWFGRGGEVTVRAFVGGLLFAASPLLAAWIFAIAG